MDLPISESDLDTVICSTLDQLVAVHSEYESAMKHSPRQSNRGMLGQMEACEAVPKATTDSD